MVVEARQPRHGHHDPLQVGPLKGLDPGGLGIGRIGPVEIEHHGPASGAQHPVQLGQARAGICQVAQSVGHGCSIGPVGRQSGGQGIPLEPAHGQPGLGTRPTPGQNQGGRRRIQPHHLPARPQGRGQQQGEIPRAAAKINEPLPRSGGQPGKHQPFPVAMQPETEQIVEQVVAGGDRLEQIAHRGRIAGLHSGATGRDWSDPGQGRTMASRLTPLSNWGIGGNWTRASSRFAPVRVSTITVARPTAAEHTMQPASIKENSRRSLAACIRCRAQATRATTATTMTKAKSVRSGAGSTTREDKVEWSTESSSYLM